MHDACDFIILMCEIWLILKPDSLCDFILVIRPFKADFGEVGQIILHQYHRVSLEMNDVNL